MANEENKPPGSNEFTGLVAVLVLFFSAVWVDNAPLTTSRPQPEEIPGITQAGVKARLWQDPFAAVQRERAKPRKNLRNDVCLERLPGDFLHEKRGESEDANIVALGVMVQEASWESVEEIQGRRQRYAVLAALNRLGYVPDDAEKLQCLEIIETAENPKPLVIPYEFFTRTSPNAKKTQVALFWLNELAFEHKPLGGIRELFGVSMCNAVPEEVDEPIRIIGPLASSTVKDLVVEAQKPDLNNPLPSTPYLLPRNKLMFFSSSATAADEFLLPADHQDQALPEFLASLGSKEGTESQAIFFERVTSTDDKLVHSLVKELTWRGLDQNLLQANKAYIALISEWDTLYAQTLPQTFKRELNVQKQCNDKGDGCPILLFSYLRGLDGLLPGKGEANADRRGKNNEESEKNGATIERPAGDSQIDYLRRLTDRLSDRERLLRSQGKELKAIGVFGNDVYDKLLVLEALRVRFPGKVLFTSDLDAAYLHPDEFKSVSHNLIVASAFGLTLNPYLQGSIPPFRDTYQTGTFLATQVALSMDQFGGSIEKPEQRIEVHNRINEWFTQQEPRVFEIGRTRAVSLNDPADGQSGNCTVVNCQSVHPASESEMGKLSGHRAKFLHFIKLYAGAFLLLTLLWLLLCLLWREARRKTRNIWRWLRRHPQTAVIGFIGLLAVVYSINYLAFFAKNEELFSWVEGVSMWPAELIRLTTLLLCIVLSRRGWRLIQWNDFVVSKRFFPDSWRIAIVASASAKQGLPDTVKDYWRELVRPNRFVPQSPQEIWIEHIYPRTFSARLLRAIVPALMFVVVGVTILNLVGPPERPYRGEMFGRLDFIILFSTLFAVQVLMFFVAEATARCNRMVGQLKKAAHWPQATLAALELTNCSAVEQGAKTTRKVRYDSLFDPLLDMHLIAERTDVLSGLIYYPFIVLALFISSRTSLFDNWYTPSQLALIFLLSFSIPVISALRLRNNAEDLRRIAIEKLSLCVLAEKGADNPKLLGQLEEAIKQVKSMDKGAFRPFTQQPWLKALFLPLSSWSGLTILEFLITTNF